MCGYSETGSTEQHATVWAVILAVNLLLGSDDRILPDTIALMRS